MLSLISSYIGEGGVRRSAVLRMKRTKGSFVSLLVLGYPQITQESNGSRLLSEGGRTVLSLKMNTVKAYDFRSYLLSRGTDFGGVWCTTELRRSSK